MGAKNIWVGNKAWPSGRSCGEFGKDVFRIAGAKTDKEKALAFYDWFIRCMHRGMNPQKEDGCGTYSRCYDPLEIFTSWGHGECTFWGWVATEILNCAGLKTRRTCVHNVGHTYFEIWYKGDDGIEQWHAFDPFGGWYFLNHNGEVASCEQLAADPQLVQNPLPGHPVLGVHPDRGNFGHRHRTEDNLYVEQAIFDERLGWDLKKGQEITINWRPAVANHALFTHFPDKGEAPKVAHWRGACDDRGSLSRSGELLHPEHEAYWKNYRFPPATEVGCGEQNDVRFHGTGALRWKPLLQGDNAPAYAVQAKFEDGCLKPTGPHTFTEAWYHIKLPYLISHLQLDYDIAGGGGDYCGFCISADDRRSIWSLKQKSYAPHWGTIQNGQADWKAGKPSVQGLKEFWLRVDMFTHNKNPTLALQALSITVEFQHNMNLQPRLLPGENPLYLEAETLDDDSILESEWIFQANGTQEKIKLKLDSAGLVEENIQRNEKYPSEIFMTGLRLMCK